ncbi:MAG TPA: glutathione S-transferase [Bdellovibrionota bacterium]|nr:glutathione S-transferase [Bdellovibrionota bacterium]
MPYTLVTSLRSPFGRICRMFMHHHGIPYDLRVLNFVDNTEDAAALASESPINKVPIMELDGDQKLFDSRVIVAYLTGEYRLSAPSVEEENIVSAIYSCMDVSVVLFLMKNSGYDIDANNSYLRRQRERIPRNLEYIKNWAASLDPANPAHWNYASMSLYSFLYWAEHRTQTVHLNEQPIFASFMKKFESAPGVRETHFEN